ncbi:MAG: MFS transporter [candidate division WOR-3 bacterium]|nr:MFS transporter [candidate division WOR-3 bacterium]
MLNLIPRGYPRDIWVIFFARIVTAVGFSVSMPFFSLYMHNELGIKMTVVGIILMLATVTGAVLGIYGGELSDRRGRKWVMVRSLLWRFVIFAIMGFFIARRANILIITSLLVANNAFGSFFIPASQSYVADLTGVDKRTTAYGLLRIGGNFGWALGLILGGLLVTIDYSVLFYFTSACMLVGAVLLIRFSKESLHAAAKSKSRPVGLREILSVTADQRFLKFTIICTVIFMVWGQLVYPLSVYSVNSIGITKPQLSILFSINGLLVVFFQYLVTNLIPPKKELSGLWVGSVIYGIGYLVVGFAAGMNLLILAVVVITIGEMVVTPTSLSYASIIAKDAHTGRYLGFFNLAQSLGWAVAPLVGGILIDTFTGRSLEMWAIICGLAFLAAIGFSLFKKQFNNKL